MAIGSGQLTGKGLNNNEVASANKGNFVSESQTDFIFSVAEHNHESLLKKACLLSDDNDDVWNRKPFIL